HVRNIGKSEGGASPAEVAERVLGVITASASKVGTAALTKALGNLKDFGSGAAKAATDAVDGAGSRIKGLFGQ
ncbi:MAG: hypothetical protein KGJ13_07850, partial [Patescibacteria group bacterium]|nr:hypothetical protein [Patescibacteria group bacterium]